MKKEVLHDDLYFHSDPYDYDDIGDDEVTLWHDSGRAARIADHEDDAGVCFVSLFYGSDPWAGPIASGVVRSEADLKAIVKGWCESNLTPSTHKNGQSLIPPEKQNNGLF